jgi:hypothetical protein
LEIAAARHAKNVQFSAILGRAKKFLPCSYSMCFRNQASVYVIQNIPSNTMLNYRKLFTRPPTFQAFLSVWLDSCIHKHTKLESDDDEL